MNIVLKMLGVVIFLKIKILKGGQLIWIITLYSGRYILCKVSPDDKKFANYALDAISIQSATMRNKL